MDEFRKLYYSQFFFIFSWIMISAANDTIDTSQSIKDGETLVSSGGFFELGFFNTRNSSNLRYLGIWYKNITVKPLVWVANREVPLTTTSGVLELTAQGNLVLLNDTNGTVIWSSSNTMRSVPSPVAQLLDSGNLVVKDANDDRISWQRFDRPSDTLLSGMSLGWDYARGVETYLSSWRSDDDPAPGVFTYHLDPAGYPQLVLKNGDAIMHRIGPWNGNRFSGELDPGTHPTYRPVLQMSANKVYYREDTVNPGVVSKIIVSSNGFAQRVVWNPRVHDWTIYASSTGSNCDSYNFCGANSVCDLMKSPNCGCLDKFVAGNLTNGCVRRIPLKCRGDVFLKFPGIKLPDARNSSFNEQGTSLADCKAECSSNCTCVAYTQLNVIGDGSGCLFYHGDLIDVGKMLEGGQDLYIRMDSTELESEGKKRVILIASLTSGTGLVLLCLIHILVWKKKCSNKMDEGSFLCDNSKESELPFFTLSTILKATNNFSINNKLGEGGFGPVFRGMLEDGQEIAVKRLSKSSLQGVDELKNEVVLIAKLQHRNLVKLLGCCIQGEENALIYEFMPNSSLDLILFDETKSMLLDWAIRFNIINGIARGLLYLHQDSRLRIIHRDLKASNILLDADMNAKISDFGLAKSFKGNETEARTRRVVGTYGYMSPEYAIDGLFSIKSDVFSFGVLMLEIMSGKRNRGFALKDHSLNLLGHAWILYKEDRSCELVDASLVGTFDLSQAMRYIHVGLLCIQKCPEDRPSMSSVIFMLENEVELPPAKQPGFFTERDVTAAQISNRITAADSVNQVTITLPEGR
ncbi:hypothetical protein OROHE_017799 [Orobanche hederae]